MPGVFRHDEPFAPEPLVMQAKAPEVSLAEHVVPADVLFTHELPGPVAAASSG